MISILSSGISIKALHRALLALLLSAAPAWAVNLDAKIAFDISPQPLVTALIQFSKQTQLQVMSSGVDLKERKAPRISGRYTIRQALELLLAGSGLAYNSTGPNTIAVTGPAAVKTSQVDARDALVLAGTRTSASGKAVADDGVEEMLVEGERDKPAPFSTANLDLTRTEDDVLPFTVFTARDVELSGAASLQEFLQNRLPQNFNADIPDELDGAGTDQQRRVNRVDLRGWGAQETVFLLNGRRMSAQYQGISTDASNATPDLQSIPLGSIERIEILTSAGSVIYGENATGGIINIITRQDYKGGQFMLGYETPSDANAPRRRVDFNYGLPLKWGVGLRLSAGYSDSEPLLAKHRSDVTIERWRKLAMERQPTRLINRLNNNPLITFTRYLYGATPNIHATDYFFSTSNLYNSLPGAPSSNFTSVPAGYAGGGGLSAFQPGVYNLELADGAAGSNLYARGSSLGVINDNKVLAVGLDRSFGILWKWSLDYRHSQNHSRGNPNGARFFTLPDQASYYPIVPMDAPANPFGQDVEVYLIDPRLQRPELTSRPGNVTEELSSTLRGNLGAWRTFLDFSYSHNKNQYDSATFHEPFGGWYNAFLSGAYNPFVDVRTVAPATPDFYQNYISLQTHSVSATRSYQSAIKASGPILDLPAGELQVTAGGEWSKSNRYKSFSISQYRDAVTGGLRVPVSAPSDTGDHNQTPSRRFIFSTLALYAEMSAPILSPRQGVPLIDSFEFFGSARMSSTRREGFNFFGDPFEYTNDSHVHALGLSYAPVSGITLRASQSIGYRPPDVEEITPYTPVEYGYTENDLIPVSDPRRNGEQVLLPLSGWASFGNPDLRAETSRSGNFGLVLTPSWMPGSRISVDYVQSIRSDAIYPISAQEMVNFEADFPGRIRRGAPGNNPDGIGAIEFVDFTYINLNEIASKSVDFSFDARVADFAGGHLMFSLLASRNISFKVQAAPTSLPAEQIRNLNGSLFSRQIEWNANGQLRWEGRHWSLGWSTRYFDYLLVRASDRLLQGADRAPWKLNHDVNFSYRTQQAGNRSGWQSMLSNTAFTLGVKNVFDRAPRFWAAATDRGIAPFDSVMGRSVWLQMRKSFE